MLPKVKQFKSEVTFEKDLLDFTARRSIKLGSDLDGNAARKQFRMSRRLLILILTRSPIRVINFRPLPSSAHHQFRSDHPSKSTSEQIIKLTVSLSSRFPRKRAFVSSQRKQLIIQSNFPSSKPLITSNQRPETRISLRHMTNESNSQCHLSVNKIIISAFGRLEVPGAVEVTTSRRKQKLWQIDFLMMSWEVSFRRWVAMKYWKCASRVEKICKD